MQSPCAGGEALVMVVRGHDNPADSPVGATASPAAAPVASSQTCATALQDAGVPTLFGSRAETLQRAYSLPLESMNESRWGLPGSPPGSALASIPLGRRGPCCGYESISGKGPSAGVPPVSPMAANV